MYSSFPGPPPQLIAACPEGTIQFIFYSHVLFHTSLNKECLCLYFVAAADTIADRSFQIVCRDEISGMGFQNRFLKGKQLWLDVVHLAFWFNCSGWHTISVQIVPPIMRSYAARRSGNNDSTPIGRLTGGLQYLTYVFLTLQFFLRNRNIHHSQRNHPPIFFT